MKNVAGTLRVPSALECQHQKLVPQKAAASGGRHAERACYFGRRGAAMIVLLAALAVMMIMFLAAVKLALVQRKTIALNAWQVQAGWLADSGVQRAAARLTADASYHGETWNVSPQDINGRDGGTVAIRVEPAPGKPDRRTIHVEADYPSDPQQRARETRELIINVSGTLRVPASSGTRSVPDTKGTQP
jgi:hypothetical protein